MSLNGPKQIEQTFVDKQQEQIIIQDPFTNSTTVARRAEKSLQAFIYQRNRAAQIAYEKHKQKEKKK